MVLGAENQQQVIIVPKQTIVNPCIYFLAVKDVHNIPNSIYNRNNAKQTLQKHPIFMTDSDHDHILEKIEHRYIIEPGKS